MNNGLPEQHVQENLKLVGEAYVDLYEIQLRNGTRLYLKASDPVKWNGQDWEGIPIALEGVEFFAEEKVARPKLSVINPDGVFSSIVRDGDLDRAKIYRYRVLREHLDADVPIYQKNVWIIWKPTLLTNKVIEFECHNPLDQQNFITPGRQYIPPDFPSVSLL